MTPWTLSSYLSPIAPPRPRRLHRPLLGVAEAWWSLRGDWQARHLEPQAAPWPQSGDRDVCFVFVFSRMSLLKVRWVKTSFRHFRIPTSEPYFPMGYFGTHMAWITGHGDLVKSSDRVVKMRTTRARVHLCTALDSGARAAAIHSRSSAQEPTCERRVFCQKVGRLKTRCPFQA